MQDQTVAQTLARLSDEIRSSGAAMAASGVVAICRRCDEQGGGSCCGAGIEDRYDGITLLINLLLGGAIPTERQVSGGCYFLGPMGCLLRAREVICVNFMCSEVTDHVSAQALSSLRDAEGVELETLITLHRRIQQLLG